MSSQVYELLVYICEAFIVGVFYMNLLQPKLKIRYCILIWAEIVAFGMAITPAYTIVRVTVIAVFELIAIFIIYKDKLFRKIVFFCFAEIISLISSITSYFLFTRVAKQSVSFLQSCRSDNCTYTLLYIIILSILISMVFQLVKNIHSIELPWVLGTQLIIGIGECAIILAVAGYQSGVIETSGSTLIVVAVICLISANLSIGILASFLIKCFSMSQNLDFGKELSNMEYKYYEMSVENDKKLQSLRHDIANQIQTVYALLINGQSQKSIELVDELKTRYGHVERLVYCENSVLNIILANKKAEAEKQGVEVQIKIRDFPKKLPISDFDLSTVMCNMVDNAIRGCICSNQSRPRMIIEILCKNEYLVIRILNSCVVSMNIESTDRIETTKSNSQTHGFGMSIIAGTVKRYKGDFVVSARNGLFTATAIMSIK